ncbi:MAG TPA: acyl-CoA dehydrogenase family protein [Jatrophihabitantaceae bacterium]|jgi:acyl-CoA dehydrogenase
MTSAYRSPWLDDEALALRELAEKFFANEVVAHQQKWDEQQHVDREVWTKAGELGLLCCSIPTEYGGGGGTFAHDLAVIDAQARTGDTAFGGAVHSGIVAHYLLTYGTEEQKHRWLPRMATGELIAAVAMTEPSGGSDLKAVKTRAVRDGDEYVINGAKTFISNGHTANLITLVATTDPSAGAKGISLIMLETDDCPGFVRGRILDKLGQHGADTSELFFEDVRVPVANVLGGVEGRGFAQLMTQLAQERLLLAVLGAAVMELAVDMTVDYVKGREAFGRTLFDFQNTKFTLAECATAARVARVFVDDCVQRHLDGNLDAATAAMAKWWVSEQQCTLVDRCLQLFGGYGYMREYPIARLFIDARVQKIYGGSNEIMKDLVARSL